MSGANFSRADLLSADFSEANLTAAKFPRLNLLAVHFLGSSWRAPEYVDTVRGSGRQ
ncbi:pentapeptide repeat-containing protein [Halorubrum sp. Ea8]|uniref:pentapeptide repeat-containing protein n=1 Tax=Halorubrum sp. Ea8 TaxID=1383841 RepID=UPI000B998868|nr:hypothetical protein DJ74_12475 [Halorubrum sp. Ea8]